MTDQTYKVVNGTHYDHRTPDRLITVLESVRRSNTRVVLTYGDPETGETQGWEEATPRRGTIGRSVGSCKTPLLLRTSRSMGGEAILDYCVVQVRTSKGGHLLYDRFSK